MVCDSMTVAAAIKAGCNMESNLNAPHAYNTSGFYITNMNQVCTLTNRLLLS